VCESCGLGLLLEAAAAVAPTRGDAFLVVDESLSICAVSDAAEELLATTEADVVNRHVAELLVPAESEEAARANLVVAITWAARGAPKPRKVTVRPANTFGLRLRARITACGPRKAALLVFL
jgi:PAS domain-containing protein